MNNKEKLISLCLTLLMILMPFSCSRKVAVEGPGTIIEVFKNPDVDARPMARMWFTDAGAGASEEGLAMVAKQISEMAEGGFGGVEIAYLSDGAIYSNEEAKEIGWGSENWRKILKQVLKTANAVEAGFKVDITITAHWPPTINTIDPNDDEASKEAAYAYRKITAADIAAGKIDVPIPVQKKEDYFRGNKFDPGKSAADFLFVDRFIAATVARVSGFDAEGNPVFEVTSLQDVTEHTGKKSTDGPGRLENGMVYAGYPAGIPDREYCEELGLDYNDILDDFGPEPADPDFVGKIDREFNRKRMADWQYLYETDLSGISGLTASADDMLHIGDYVIFGSFYRGTGQVLSGGDEVVMYNRCYATDYFSDIAVQKIIDYWNDVIIDDELRALLKENGEKNGTSIFEDSIEIHKEGPAWVYDFYKEFATINGYDGAKFAPVMVIGSAARFDDPATATRIIEDYNLTMGNLYSVEHAARISQWAKGFIYTYRAQGYPLPGLDVCGAAIALDVPEGDNSTAGDGVRQLASAVYMKGDKMLSMESTTFSANIFSEWVDVMKELNADFSHGVSRSILHGSAFARNFNGYQSEWPGWNFFKFMNGGGFSSWNGRQIYWDEVETASNYIARIQAVVQNGQAKVDLAVLLDTESGYRNQSGNSLQELLDVGYAYSIMSEPVLMLDRAYVEDGILAPDGPAYKALVVKEAGTMSATLMNRILGYAQKGLPVIFYNCDISRIYGTNRSENNDDQLKNSMADLMEMDNFHSAGNQAEILASLEESRIEPAAHHNQPGLEITHRMAGEGIYYYLYNGKGATPSGFGPPGGGFPGGPGSSSGAMEGDASAPVITSGAAVGGTGYPIIEESPGETVPSGMPGGPPGGRPGSGPGGPPGGGPGGPFGGTQQEEVDNSISATVTLEGDGVPYILDAWTGDIIPVAEYSSEEGDITLNIELKGRESMIICIAENTQEFPEVGKVHATAVSGGSVAFDGSVLVHRVSAAGSYTVDLSDGTTKPVQVDQVPEKLNVDTGWDLELESWGPSPEAASLSLENQYGYEVDPTVSVKRSITFKGIELGTWSDLPVSAEQLELLGVDSMDKVSGIGSYSTTFQLPGEWSDHTGALLQLTHLADMIVEVNINGHLFNDINQFTNCADVGNWLQSGTNEIRIKLATTLQNRASTMGTTSYGLTGVILIPYFETLLE